MVEFETNGVKVQVIPKNIKIIDSYKIKDKKLMKTIILDILYKAPMYETKRSIRSLVREWKSHNIMYNWGWFISHTKDCNLESKEVLYKKFIYLILGGF